MDLSTLSVLSGFFQAIFNPSDSTLNSQDLVARKLLDEKPIEWVCMPHKWEKDVMVGKVLHGIVSTQCEFVAIGGGGYPMLDAYLIKRVQDEATKVHSGPTLEKYKDLSSIYFDVSVLLGGGKENQATVRQDVHLATDGKTQYYFDSFSTSISGVGYGKYLKKADVESKVSDTKVAGRYAITVRGSFQVEKPWFAPEGVFRSEIKKSLNDNIKKIEQELIDGIARNIL